MARFWLRSIQEGVAECEIGGYIRPSEMRRRVGGSAVPDVSKE
jgi:hypothetical protein